MVEIRKTEKYALWLDGLRDLQARARIQVRVERLAAGNARDVKPVGEGVSDWDCWQSGGHTPSPWSDLHAYAIPARQ
jgi:putative addiction module killer protein